MAESNYIYLGDRLTDEKYKGKECSAVRDNRGKCIRGRNGTMLVSFNEEKCIVIGRLLRKLKTI
jgi:hypothetical protein